MASEGQARVPPSLADKKKVFLKKIVGGCGSDGGLYRVWGTGAGAGAALSSCSYCCRMHTPATAAQKLDQLRSNTANLTEGRLKRGSLN